MINVDDIDKHILLVAEALFYGMTREQLVETYTNEGYEPGEVLLLMAAGQIICQDRKNAVPTKKPFRRVL